MEGWIGRRGFLRGWDILFKWGGWFEGRWEVGLVEDWMVLKGGFYGGGWVGSITWPPTSELELELSEAENDEKYPRAIASQHTT